MPLYVVVHHQRDQHQPWVNAWLDDQMIEAIQTTREIGKLCSAAKERSEKVDVHRCGWGEFQPMIGCAAEVESVAAIDKSSVLVRFTHPKPLSQNPLLSPVKGQNFYRG